MQRESKSMALPLVARSARSNGGWRSLIRCGVPALLLLLGLGGCIGARHVFASLRGGPAQQELVIELPSVRLPASAGHGDSPQPEPLWTTSPVTGWVHGFSVEVVDAGNDTLPSRILHHVKLMALEKRDLFHPIMLRVFGAGSETRQVVLPTSLGFPLAAGDSLLATAMLHNPTGETIESARVRLRLRYTPAPAAEPLAVYPFFVHVTPPDAHSGYDLPPGRSERSWEARPAVEGRILGFGGHMHRYGTELRFEDVTAGRILWRAIAKRDANGEIIEIPRKMYVWTPGVVVYPDHVYRVTAVYDNPTGDTIRDGGMGTVGGIVQPLDAWPSVNRSHPLYALDRAREVEHGGTQGHHHH